jgi:hypothetical protein
VARTADAVAHCVEHRAARSGNVDPSPSPAKHWLMILSVNLCVEAAELYRAKVFGTAPINTLAGGRRLPDAGCCCAGCSIMDCCCCCCESPGTLLAAPPTTERTDGSIERSPLGERERHRSSCANPARCTCWDGAPRAQPPQLAASSCH